jgi:hypothetical protein
MASVSQITHSGIFDTDTVEIVTTQVDRLKGFRLKDFRLKGFRLKVPERG